VEDTDYALGRTSAEYDRLIEQAELLRPITERMLRAAGICAGMRVLDVGCGVGDVSFLVRELVGPQGCVVGVDLDRDAVHIAEQRCTEKQFSNVSFSQGDARSIATGRLFDAAVGRLVLMFTSDPTEALRLIAEQVRPGGFVAFHERVGERPSAMNQPVLASLKKLLSVTFERSGARLGIDAELYWRMLDAGLDPEPQPLAEIAVTGEQGDLAYRRWMLITHSLLPKIVEYELATEKELFGQYARKSAQRSSNNTMENNRQSWSKVWGWPARPHRIRERWRCGRAVRGRSWRAPGPGAPGLPGSGWCRSGIRTPRRRPRSPDPAPG
jgi:ubiquinone/menaquinone biosynthesis C-methylase UbiE